MEKKRRRLKTNKDQYAKMVELAKLKPDIGQGLPLRPTDEIEEFWENLAQECNMLGPPIKDAFEWKKIWILWKVFVKRKLTKCVKKQTKRRMTHLEVEVVKMIKNPGNEIPPDSMPILRPPKQGKCGMNNEYLDEAEDSNIDQEFLTDSDDDDTPSNTLPKQQSEDPLSTSFQYNDDGEEDSEKTLLQQQIDIQKNLYKETQEFQMNTSAALQDIALTLNTLRGGIKGIEDMSAQSLREEMRLNRKTEDLLQKLVERDFIKGNRKK